MTRSRDGGQTSEVPVPVEGVGLGARLRTGAAFVAIAALGLFFFQNLQEVRMHFLWFDWDTRLIFALFVSAAAGGVAAWLIGALRRRARDPRR